MKTILKAAEGFTLLLCKYLDKLKHRSPTMWLFATAVLILILVGVHLNWFVQLETWLKTTLEGLIITLLSSQGSRTSEKLSKVKKDEEVKEDESNESSTPIKDISDFFPDVVSVPTKQEIVQSEPVQDITEPIQSIEPVEPVGVDHYPPALQILVKRHTFLKDTTIGDVYVNGEYLCKMLEDTDRDLNQQMTPTVIQQLKIWGNTCIPYGTYQVVVSYSNKFKKLLPELINVPGYTGVRLHPGNTHVDTHGCPLPITSFQNEVGLESSKAFNKLFTKIKSAQKKQKVFLTIEKAS